MAWPSTSRHARGYGTAWDKLRLRILKRDGYLCRCDQCKGGELRITPANEVDHIKPKAAGGTDDPSNLRAINADCHKRKTDAEVGRKPRVRFGLDGFPIGDGHPWSEG